MDQFDLSRMDEMKDALNSPGPSGPIVVRASLVWDVAGAVVAIPDPEGKFLFNTNYLPR